MRIGDRLIKAGLITDEQLHRALQEQRSMTERKRIVRVLVDMDFITEENLLEFFVEQCNKGMLDLDSVIEDFPASEEEILQRLCNILKIDMINLDQEIIDPATVDLVPFIQIKRHYAIPYKETQEEIFVAVITPFDLALKETFQRAMRNKPIRLMLTTKEQLVRHVARLELNDSIKDLIEKIRRELKTGTSEDSGDSSSIMRLIETIFDHAVEVKASDVHIEANEGNTAVRCRVDGVLQESFVFERDMYPPLASRLKLLSNLDIAEKRKPQDGRFSATIKEREFDFRISTLPVITGESIVTRILDKSKVLVKLEDMGFSQVNYNRFTKAIKSPYGIVFVTGPTGSGKTTTLYAALNAIKGIGHKIITVEDPVEYQMNLINQVMVNEKAGMNFPAALRSILRQDPDIIMIGEIRDKETMRIAVQAALTGHLVLSTLHTNDAISAVSRLIDMGIESFFVGSSMAGIEAQRLVRSLCQHCVYEVELPKHILEELSSFISPDAKFYKSHGCKHCNMTGYSGRALISEVLLAGENIKKLIVNNASKEEIAIEARKDGFVTMFEDGLQKAMQGLTSIEEVYRVAKLP